MSPCGPPRRGSSKFCLFGLCVSPPISLLLRPSKMIDDQRFFWKELLWFLLIYVSGESKVDKGKAVV